MTQFWFKSDLFDIEPGEDDDINPRIYGRQLANWLKQRLEESGYKVEPVILEDWGRCLMLTRDPFRLWIGCGNVTDLEDDAAAAPAGTEVVWTCFTEAEIPFWKRLFGKPDTGPAIEKLTATLESIFANEPRIQQVPEP